MPDNQNPSAVQEPPVSNPNNTQIENPLDLELENSLNSLFKKTPEPEKALNNVQEEQPTENPLHKPDAQPKQVETKPENPSKQGKAENSDSTLPDPDKIENNPSKNQQGWNSLKNNYKRAHKALADKDQEISRLKSVVAEKGETTTKEVEELKKQIQELSGYRAMVDIQADPEFVNKYDAPFNKNVETIKTMLGDMKVSEEVIKGIDFNDTQYMKYLIGLVMTNKDTYTPDQLYTSKKLQTKIEDLIELSEKREESILDQKTKHKEYLENKKKEGFVKNAETEGKMIKRLEEVAKTIPFLKRMTPKEGANEAEILQVDKHNEMVDAMTQKVQGVMKEMETPEGKVNASVASVAAHYFQGLLKDRDKTIAGLREELKKISTVSSDGEKTRQPSAAPRNSNGQFRANGEIKDVDTALAEFRARSR